MTGCRLRNSLPKQGIPYHNKSHSITTPITSLTSFSSQIFICKDEPCACSMSHGPVLWVPDPVPTLSPGLTTGELKPKDDCSSYSQYVFNTNMKSNESYGVSDVRKPSRYCSCGIYGMQTQQIELSITCQPGEATGPTMMTT
jgi:hypothetical protein